MPDPVDQDGRQVLIKFNTFGELAEMVRRLWRDPLLADVKYHKGPRFSIRVLDKGDAVARLQATGIEFKVEQK